MILKVQKPIIAKKAPLSAVKYCFRSNDSKSDQSNIVLDWHFQLKYMYETELYRPSGLLLFLEIIWFYWIAAAFGGKRWTLGPIWLCGGVVRSDTSLSIDWHVTYLLKWSKASSEITVLFSRFFKFWVILKLLAIVCLDSIYYVSFYIRQKNVSTFASRYLAEIGVLKRDRRVIFRHAEKIVPQKYSLLKCRGFFINYSEIVWGILICFKYIFQTNKNLMRGLKTTRAGTQS